MSVVFTIFVESMIVSPLNRVGRAHSGDGPRLTIPDGCTDSLQRDRQITRFASP